MRLRASSKDSKLLLVLVQYATTVVAGFVFVLGLAVTWAATALLDPGTTREVVVALGASAMSAAVVGFAWDLTLHRQWVSFVREELVSLFTRPEVLSAYSSDRNAEVLKALLVTHHGTEMGEALHRQSHAMSRRNGAERRDFTYNIELSKRDGCFHAATFHVSFVLPCMPAKADIHFAHVTDGLDLHARYEQLEGSEVKTLYRYILQSEHAPDLDADFQVDRASVRNTRTNEFAQLDADKVARLDADGIVTYALEPRGLSAHRYRKCFADQPCKVTLDISTVFDVSRNSFPIWFGYPVHGFSSSFSMGDISANTVDVMQFFSSADRYERLDPHIQNGFARNRVAGKVNGVMLPDSGLAYIWR